MQVRLLGPVDVFVDGQPRRVGGLRRRAVLAVLALHPGQVVGVDRLIDLVWGADPPSTAVNTLQRHVSDLRRLLGERAAVLARSPGYVLDLVDGSTDVEVAEELVDRARRSTDPRDRVRQIQHALGLWRGRPLLDLTGVSWLEAQAYRLDQLRLQAVRVLGDARLSLGEHVELVPELERLTEDHPFDEQIHAQLILALYRAGRQADALHAYQRLRSSLDKELGIEPGRALRDLEVAILRQDPELDAPRPWEPAPATTAGAVAEPPARPVPAQLPLSTHAFAGRHAELADLDAVLPGATLPGATLPGGAVAGATRRAVAVVVTAIAGTAGVGKSALAVYWAHRVADRFPDGQLYVNLRGFDPSGVAVAPGSAIRGFLEALGVPANLLPSGFDAQTALYRSLLAGRRVLVLLDNARDVDQVRPLLPGTAGSLAVVTSRNPLRGLVVAEGAHPVTLDVLPAGDAADLLVRRLGPARVEREPDAVREMIRRCAGLPLALTIVAARAESHPAFPLATLAAELRESSAALAPFQGDDPATDIRAVFSWSYRTLSSDAARLFRLSSVHPGPDLGVGAAASLAGAPAAEVRGILAELTGSSLFTERVPGRYTHHDLLHAYATYRSHLDDSPQDRRAALIRVLDHYLHTAHRATRLLYRPGALPQLDEPVAGVVPERFTTVPSAAAWFARERSTLLAAVSGAAAAGLDGYVCRIARSLTTYFSQRAHWQDLLTVSEAAVAAARRSGADRDLAGAHLIAGRACVGLSRTDDAAEHLRASLALLDDLGDRAGRAVALLGMASMLERQGRYPETIQHAQRALAEFHSAGDRVGRARAMVLIGEGRAGAGELDRAVDTYHRALTILGRPGESSVEADVQYGLGQAYERLGRYEAAAAAYGHARRLWQEIGDLYGEALAAGRLGDTHLAAGDRAPAEHAWRDALDLLTELGHDDAVAVRAKLANLLDRTPAPAAC